MTYYVNGKLYLCSICSGHMDARDKLSRGMKIGLGTGIWYGGKCC